ncbi:hypothetical protein Hanom_Chr01g00031041 [Helianthus anomalus]
MVRKIFIYTTEEAKRLTPKIMPRLSPKSSPHRTRGARVAKCFELTRIITILEE